MQVGNNTAAFSTWKNYTNSVSHLRKSMSKLSSGSRIQNAGDDPSGLAMSERLRTQSRNTAAAANNVENRLNHLQTADSWMQKIHDMLGRMGELAVMANDGTKNPVDQKVLQDEFVQMQDEIARITDGPNPVASFDGKPMFDGHAISLQVGADGGQTFTGTSFDLQKASAETLAGGSDWGDLINSGLADKASGLVAIEGTEGDAAAAVGLLAEGIDFISEKRAALGAEMKRMEQTLDGLHSYEENITATESRIRDVDVAKETSEMSKYNILQQVGTAMLAQANQLPQGVLQLVG